MSLERRVRAYIAALEAGAIGDDLASFYHVDVVLDEYPNRLNPAGARRGLAQILEGAVAGQRLMARQIFEVVTLSEVGDRVVVELNWAGELAAPMGMLKSGDKITARIAQVIEFEDEKIIRQRTYDCFDQF